MEKEKKEQLQNTNRVLYSVIIIIAVLCIIVGISFAIFKYLKPGEKPNQVTTGTLIVKLIDGEGIDVDKALPMSDEAGKAQTPYHFEITNDGTLNSKYRIILENDQEAISEDGCGARQLSDDQIKYLLTIDGEDQEVGKLSDLKDRVLETGTINAGEEPVTKTYDLRLWLDSTIEIPEEVANKHLHVKIRVEAIQDQYVDFDEID